MTTNPASIEEVNVEKPIAIVFVHGNSMSKKIWQKQLNAPELDQFHLISFDLPGHGEARRMDSYSLALLTDSIADVCNRVSKPMLLVGHSLGANLVLQGIQRISQCHGVILVSSVPAAKPLQEDMMQPKEAAGYFFAPELTAEQVSEMAGLLVKPEKKASFVEADLKKTDGKVRSGILQSIIQAEYNDETEILKNLGIPVILFWGENESIYNYSALAKIPHLQTVLIANASHCPQWENDSEFNNRLLEFSALATI